MCKFKKLNVRGNLATLDIEINEYTLLKVDKNLSHSTSSTVFKCYLSKINTLSLNVIRLSLSNIYYSIASQVSS